MSAHFPTLSALYIMAFHLSPKTFAGGGGEGTEAEREEPTQGSPASKG